MNMYKKIDMIDFSSEMKRKGCNYYSPEGLQELFYHLSALGAELDAYGILCKYSEISKIEFYCNGNGRKVIKKLKNGNHLVQNWD